MLMDDSEFDAERDCGVFLVPVSEYHGYEFL